MENASKALLIAAAVLVVIILIAVGMKIYSSTTDAQKVGINTGDTISQRTGEATDIAIEEITGKLGKDAWVDNGDETFSRREGEEKVTICIGDYVGYDHTNGNKAKSYTSYATSNPFKNGGRVSGWTEDQTFDPNNYRNGWRVFGIDNKGRLQLISTTVVGELILKGIDGYQYSVEELNAISSAYANGEGAVEGRSINVDDVNKMSGYNPLNDVNGEPYGKGTMYEYGKDVTFYWRKNQYNNMQIFFEYERNGQISNSDTIGVGLAHPNGFWYYQDSKMNFSEVPDRTKYDVGETKKIITIKNTAYRYSLGMQNTSNKYKILVTNSRPGYWLATRCALCESAQAGFFVFYKDYGSSYVGTNYFFRSSNDENYYGSCGIRPIITLSNKKKIIKDATHNGTASNRAYIIE